MKKKKVVIKKKLIDQKKTQSAYDSEQLSETESDNRASDIAEDEPWVSYWWSNITVSLVHENGKIPSNIPPAIMKSEWLVGIL